LEISPSKTFGLEEFNGWYIRNRLLFVRLNYVQPEEDDCGKHKRRAKALGVAAGMNLQTRTRIEASPPSHPREAIPISGMPCKASPPTRFGLLPPNGALTIYERIGPASSLIQAWPGE